MNAVITQAPSREQWLQERKKRLGATDISAILGLNPYRTAYEVWLEKRDLLEPWEGNAATRLGSLLEPKLLDEAELRWGKLERNVVVRHPQAPIAATLDGWLVDSGEPVEAKTAGMLSEFADLAGWGEENTDEIPEWYLVQVHSQLACTSAEQAKVIALIAGRGICQFSVEADKTIENVIVDTACEWWESHIVRGNEPSRDRLPSMDVLKRIKRVPNSVCAIPCVDWVDRWEAAKKSAKAAKEAVESAKMQLVASLGTHEGGLLPDGRMLTFLEQSRVGYPVEPCSYRVLRIQQPKKGKR